MGFFKRKRKYSTGPKLKQRLFRSFVSIVVLTAFVLGLSLLVRQASTMDAQKAVSLASPFLKKLGISDKVAGEVAGVFASRIFKTNIEPAITNEKGSEIEQSGSISDESKTEEISFKAAIISDSHSYIPNLIKALEVAQIQKVQSLFFLGDYTDLGEEDKLLESKKVMDAAKILYYSLPGDRDLYQSVGRQNFDKVFGQTPLSIVIGEFKFILLDNSANYTLIDNDIIEKFKIELEDADFVLLSQPIYYPNISVIKPVMGYVKGEITQDVKDQGGLILSYIRDSGVKAIFAGDHHSFSSNVDPIRSSLQHIVVGPVTDDKAGLGFPGVTILSVYEDGSYKVEELRF